MKSLLPKAVKSIPTCYSFAAKTQQSRQFAAQNSLPTENVDTNENLE